MLICRDRQILLFIIGQRASVYYSSVYSSFVMIKFARQGVIVITCIKDVAT